MTAATLAVWEATRAERSRLGGYGGGAGGTPVPGQRSGDRGYGDGLGSSFAGFVAEVAWTSTSSDFGPYSAHLMLFSRDWTGVGASSLTLNPVWPVRTRTT